MFSGIDHTVSPANRESRVDFFYFHILLIVATILSCFASSAFSALQPGWQAEVRLTNDSETSFTAPNNAKWLAVDFNGNLHVVWLDDRDRNFEIYHKTRTGAVWTADERVTDDPAYSARPNLAVDASGFLHLAWNDERDGNKEIYHNMWGGMWGADRRVTQTAGESFCSALAAEADTIHMVYMDDVSGNLQIFYRAFKNNTWTAAVPLTSIATGNRMVPSLDIGPDGTLHVAWWDTRQDTLIGKIYHRRRSGGVWLDEELLTDPENNAMRPSVAVDDSGFAHVAWIDKRGSFEQIYYRRRGPAGWESEIALTADAATHYHPSIDAAGGEAVLAYWQNVDGGANSEIFFRRRVAGSWTGPVRISNAGGASELPCLIAGPNRNLHLAWVESRDGNQEIYYREYIDPANGTGGGAPDPPPSPNVGFVLTSSPNPFGASTNVEISVPDACAASVRIYDVTGRCVRNLLSGSVPRGVHSVAWDGKDGAGRSLAPGVYFAVARAGKTRLERKILLIR